MGPNTIWSKLWNTVPVSIQPEKQIQEEIIYKTHTTRRASQVALVVKNPSTNAEDIRDTGLIPGSGRSLGERCQFEDWTP